YAVHTIEHALPIPLEQRVVELPLRALELDLQRLLDARRKLGGYLVLRATQNDRAHGARQQRAAAHVPVPLPHSLPLDGCKPRDGPERRRRAQHPWIQELE